MSTRLLPWLVFLVGSGCARDAAPPFALRATTQGDALTLTATNRSTDPQRLALTITGAPGAGRDAQLLLLGADGQPVGACALGGAGERGATITLRPGLPAVLREGLADLALAHCLQPATHYLLRATSRDAGGVLRAVSNDAGFDTPAAPAWSRAHASR